MTADTTDTRAMALVAERLNAAIGLDCGSLGDFVLSRAVKTRARELGLADPAGYPDLLCANPEELRHLVEEIVVPETWFFRDREPFRLLAEQALDKLSRGPAAFRVLSAPCSTGEEPYSIAMCLLEKGLDPARMSVNAADISDRALDAAKRGVYGPNSFRGAEPPWTARWFEPVKGEGNLRRVSREVRDLVRFTRTNLVPDRLHRADPAWTDLCRPHRFDAVFCRNFLIYLDKKAKAAMAELLRDILTPDGLLFVGHAEMIPILQGMFTPVREPGVFAYRNRPPRYAAPLPPKPSASGRAKAGRSPGTPKTPENPVSERGKKQAASPVPALTEPVMPVPPVAPAAPVARDPAPEKPTADQARALADQGRLADAARVCQNILGQGTHDPDVYHLLGVIREAEGDNAAAREHFGKALYLDPNHADSLYSMALQSERLGDAAQAARYRGRLERILGHRGSAS